MTQNLAAMTHEQKLDIEWQRADQELQVVVCGRFLAAERRQMHVSYRIDTTLKLIELHCQLELGGRRFHHDSVLRGFCQIPLAAMDGLDPETCDWLTVIDD